MEAGQVLLHLQKSDPGKMVEAAVERMRPQFAEKEIALAAELPPALPAVNADPDRIGQVLINLLGNALQNTPRVDTLRSAWRQTRVSCNFPSLTAGLALAPENLDESSNAFTESISRARAAAAAAALA